MNFSSWPPLLVVDVEGNGASPPDLVEVAALPVRGGKPDTGTARAWLSKPARSVTPFAARVHGLTDEALEGAPGWAEIGDEVHAYLGTSWIAAHHAHVDHRVLSAHLPQWRPEGVLDTLRLARAAYPDLRSHSLDALVAHLRPDLRGAPGRRHRAAYDAYATAQVLLTMAARYGSWDRLVAVAVPPGLPGGPGPEQQPTLW
ncbi:3'-5' exonuclease [Streptomyces sp. NPDC054784]